MIIRRLQKLFIKPSVLYNLYSQRNYYSAHVSQLFLSKADSYLNKLNDADFSNAHQKNNLDSLFKDFKNISSSISDVSGELNNKDNDDKELLGLMKEEKVELEVQKNELVAKLLNEIYEFEMLKETNPIPKNSDCLFEISPGVGGKEAQLFAHEMSEMYQNYFNYKNWNLIDEEIDTEGEYMRHYKAKLEGNFVWEHMKYEIGVHRVQRIPKTEARGRLVL